MQSFALTRLHGVLATALLSVISPLDSPLVADTVGSKASAAETTNPQGQAQSGQIWPMPRADFGATGAISESLADELTLRWSTETPEAIETSLVSDGQLVFYTDVMGGVGALSFQTGETVWRKNFDTGFVAPASLYLPAMLSPSPVSLPLLSTQGDLSLDQQARSESQTHPHTHLTQPLLAVGDVEGNVYGLNPATGETVWKATTDGEINAAPTFFLWQAESDSVAWQLRVLQTSQDGSLYCFAADTGELIWKYESGDQIRCGASIADGKTFLGGCDGGLHIIDLATGKAAREKLPLGGPTGSTPAIRNGEVFVPIMDGVLYAFGVDSGEVDWQYEDNDLTQDYRGDVAVNDDVIVIASRTKSVDAIDRMTGQRRWRVTLRRRADASPLIAGDDVFIAGTDGRLLRLAIDSGEQKWEFETRGAFYASPSIVAGQLLIADDEGVIRCFAPK